MNYKKVKRLLCLCCTALLLAGTVSGCGTNIMQVHNMTATQENENGGHTDSENTDTNTVTAASSDSIAEGTLAAADIFSDRDKEIGYDEEQCTRIKLADGASACDGTGVRIDGDVITIQAEGTYILSGKLSAGSVVVDAENKKVHLVLDGVEINGAGNAALDVEQADKVFVTLADGTTNKLSDAQAGTAADISSDEGAASSTDTAADAAKAALYSKDDLTINGNGTLEIQSAYGHGIAVKDDLRITGGTYQIAAAKHAISGKDSVAVLDGSFTLTAGKDGIHSENTDDTTKGYVYIQNGSYTIEAQGDGISASGILQLEDGAYDIVSGGGSAAVDLSSKQNNFAGGGHGGFTKGDFSGEAFQRRDFSDKDFSEDNFNKQNFNKEAFSREDFEKRDFPQDSSGRFPNGGRNPDSDNEEAPQLPEGELPQLSDEEIMQMQNGERPEPPEINTADKEQLAGADNDQTNDADKIQKTDETEDADATEDAVSTRGLKSGSHIFIHGGSYQLDTYDDAVHAGGAVQMDAGTFVITCGDDGVHAEEELVINAGDITVDKSYEGLEGMTITINGGNISIVSSDDGLNAAGGADQSGFNGGMGPDAFGVSEDCRIEINGGTMHVDADGDGIDSNGSLEINDGEIYVSGPENDGNAALDYGTTAVIGGGTLVAAGMSGMAENFDSSSKQCSMLVQFDTTCQGGEIILTDASGEQLAAYNTEKRFNSVYISAPQLKQGETYTLKAAGTITDITLTETNYSNVQSRMTR